MKILLTNDDGYQYEGLQKLCQRLSAKHDVYVVAPDSQRSAFSHSISFFTEQKFQRIDEYFGAKLAYASTASPAGCVKFATQLGVDFDLVISGPNNGENVGHAVLYSGTVGAAEEAVICGVKSIAISRSGERGDVDSCIDFVDENLEKLTSFSAKDTLLNINFPPCDVQICGIVVCKQGGGRFNDYYVAMPNGSWMLVGDTLPESELEVNTDVSLPDKGFITITPLTVNQTNFECIEELRKIFVK